MPSVADQIADAETRHTVYLLRYSASTYRQHSKLLDQAISDLLLKIAARSPASGVMTTARLETMLASIETTNKELYKALASAVDGDLRELAAYESARSLAVVESAYPIAMAWATVTSEQIHAAAMSRPFHGKILRDWWSDQEYGVKQAYKQAIRIGFVEGESLQQIAGRLKGVGDMQKRQVETIVRTAINHTAQTARTKFAEANADIIAEEEWSSTLDGRTSAICQARDGKRYKIGSGPTPPARPNCRAQRIPVPKSWKELGFGKLSEDDQLNERPFVADKRRVKDIPKSEREKLIGRTTAKSYNDWLKTQPQGFVEDVLGKTKAKLYLDGGLPLDRFIDRTGKQLTLKELMKKEADAFSKAGIHA